MQRTVLSTHSPGVRRFAKKSLGTFAKPEKSVNPVKSRKIFDNNLKNDD